MFCPVSGLAMCFVYFRLADVFMLFLVDRCVDLFSTSLCVFIFFSGRPIFS